MALRIEPTEYEKLRRQLDEINAQIVHLTTEEESIPVDERARLRINLTKEWLATYRNMTGRHV